MVNIDPRLTQLDRALAKAYRNNSWASLGELEAAVAETGARDPQIRRLCRILAEQYGAPIEYDRRTRKRRYTRSFTITHLPTVQLTVPEVLALVMSRQAAAQFQGTTIGQDLQSAIDRLLQNCPVERGTSLKWIREKVRFCGSLQPQLDADLVHLLFRALEDEETLVVTYGSGRGKPWTGEFDPYGLIVAENQWHLVGWLHSRREVRTLLVPRIRQVQPTERPFRVTNGWTLDEYLRTAVYGHQSTGTLYTVKLRFTKAGTAAGNAQRWSANEIRHHDPQGRLVIEFQTGALYKLEREALAWGGQLEVLAPPELQERIRQSVQLLQQSLPAPPPPR